MAIVTITDILTQARTLLLDPGRGPTVTPETPDLGGDSFMDVRIAGARDDIGTQLWTPGSTGFPFGVLSVTRTDKSYKEVSRSTSDAVAYVHQALAQHIDGIADLNTWAYAWESAMEQWFPQYYRLAELGQNGVVGDLYWRLAATDVGTFVVSGLTFFGVVYKLHLHYVNPVTWGV